MSGYELGYAYVSILPSMTKFKKQFAKEMGDILPKTGKQQGEKYGKGLMSSAGATAKKWAKRTLIGAAAGAGALAGTALTAGFQRSVKIENAQATLSGLGYNEKDIQGIMDQALGAVKGTAFGLDEAVTISSGALAAGVKDVEGYLKSVGDVATITGRGMSDIGAIFNKIMANNRLSGDEMNQLADSGIPILQLLQEEYGVTAEEARKMVSGGQVAADDFLSMMETYEGAALKSGDTTQGAFNNMRAALARLGQSALEEAFPLFKKGFGAVTDVLDWATENVGKGVDKIKSFFGSILDSDAVQGVIKLFRGEGTGMLAKALGVEQGHPLIKFLQRVRDFVKKDIPNGFKSLKGIVEGVFKVFTGQGTGQLAKSLGVEQGHPIIKTLQTVRDTAKDLFRWVLDVGIPALSSFATWVSDNRQQLSIIIPMILGAVAALKTMMFIKNVTIAIRAFSAALIANPIGLVIAAIGALVGALVWLYLNNETARKIMDAAWAGIKTAISAVVDWFKNTAWPVMKDVINKIGDVVVWLWQNIYKPYFTFILNKVKDVVGWIKDKAWPWIRDAFQNIANKAGDLKDKAVNAFNLIKDGVSKAWDGAKKILDKFKGGLDSLKDKFTSVKDGISRVWDTLTGVIAKPINKVIDLVNGFLENLRKGINKIPGVNIKGPWGGIDHVLVPGRKNTAAQNTYGQSFGPGTGGYAAGGHVPGWSPNDKADNIPAWLTAGEYVLPVRATESLRSTIGDSGMESLRRGQLPGYADGGFVGGAKALFSTGADALVGLWNNAKGFMKRVIERIMPDFGDSWPAMAVQGLLKNGLPFDKMTSALKNMTEDPANLEGGPGGPPRSNLGWQGIWGIVKSLFPDAILTSSVRNSTVAGYGTKSLHASGRAIDFALNPWSRMVGATRILSMLMPWTELIHTPAGMWQQNRGKRTANFLPITKQLHYDHVHAALAEGGYVPNLYDNGGAIPPGLSLVSNQTGKPEQVLTDSQWQDVQNNGGNTIIINGVKTDNASHVAEEVLFAQRRMGYGKYYRNR